MTTTIVDFSLGSNDSCCSKSLGLPSVLFSIKFGEPLQHDDSSDDSDKYHHRHHQSVTERREIKGGAAKL